MESLSALLFGMSEMSTAQLQRAENEQSSNIRDLKTAF